jgi:excisionase family DNA binding protein
MRACHAERRRAGRNAEEEVDMGQPQPQQDLAGDQLLLTPEEAARLLRVGRTTVYALMKTGELRPVHIGRSCRLSRAELERYVTRLEAPEREAPARPRRRRPRLTADQRGLFDVHPTPPHAG